MLPPLLTHACGSRRIYEELGVKQLAESVPCAWHVAVTTAIPSSPSAELTAPWKCYMARSRQIAAAKREKPEPKVCCALLKAGCSE